MIWEKVDFYFWLIEVSGNTLVIPVIAPSPPKYIEWPTIKKGGGGEKRGVDKRTLNHK